MNKLQVRLLGVCVCLITAATAVADTFTPFTAGDAVPRNAVDLWNAFDPTKEALDVEVVKQWEEDGVVVRYVRFTVGTFKGEPSRIAAYYTFPKGMKKGPAFVWCHGGGQRAEKERGLYFAKRGYAVVDINWNGRSMQDDIEKNTDWGALDPSQGPRFYPGALRKHYKADLSPDEHTIDRVPSPRNSNWYVLALAGRRAITFLEQQPEVDAERIGFTGYSMGGKITAMVSTDRRLKAVVPMVGGAGFVDEDFIGLPGTGAVRERTHAALYNATIDGRAYWSHVKIPVLFLNSSNDFHMPFDNIYRSAALLPHENWRATQGMHTNHSPGRKQWAMLDKWFDEHLKGDTQNIPKTAIANLAVQPGGTTAVLHVTVDQAKKLRAVNIYFSHDANARSRFWKSAEAKQVAGDTWQAAVPVRAGLPLFAFADCVYELGGTVETFRGPTDAFSITSNLCTHVPETVRSEALAEGATFARVFDDFGRGQRDWGRGHGNGLVTFKFRDPAVDFTHGKAIAFDIDAPKPNLSFRVHVSKNAWITGVKAPRHTFMYSKELREAGKQRVVIEPSEFKAREKLAMKDWSNIYQMLIMVYDGSTKSTLDLVGEHDGIVTRIEFVD